MKTTRFAIIISILWPVLAATILAQQMPQDYWYFNGLTIPGTFGTICAGPDGNIYAATNNAAIDVFTTNGTFIQQFGTNKGVEGIAIDSQTNIYVLTGKTSSGIVNKFNASGTLLLQFGVWGSGTNQIKPPVGSSGIAVGKDGNIYIADIDNNRVDVFDSNGNYLLGWPNIGGDLYAVLGIAALPDGNFCIANENGDNGEALSVFTPAGLFVAELNGSYGNGPGSGGAAICTAPDGEILFVPESGGLVMHEPYDLSFNGYSCSINVPVSVTNYGIAADRNSTLYVTATTTGTLGSISSGKPLIIGLNRYYGSCQPLNPIPVPVPYITSVQQRTNSSLIDIDYTVNDAVTSQATTAMIAFNNGSEDFSDLIHMTEFADNTGTNLGPNIAANVSHRVTWDASEGTTNFASFQFDILAGDQRSLLNLHFITIPATTNQPAITMSSGSVEDASLFNLWLWQIATNNPAVMLTNGAVVGVGGAYDQQTLASGTGTTAAGRQFLYSFLNVRAPTSTEITAAQSGNYGFISVDNNSVVQLP